MSEILVKELLEGFSKPGEKENGVKITQFILSVIQATGYHMKTIKLNRTEKQKNKRVAELRHHQQITTQTDYGDFSQADRN